MKIYWDTMIFIYLLEGNADVAKDVRKLHQKMSKAGHHLVTSTFTLGELLVPAYSQMRPAFRESVRSFFESGEIETVPFTTEIADRFAQIRAEFRLSPPDAIHVATAATLQVDFFVTNDRAVQKLAVPGMERILSPLALAASL